jgi:beta-fructofuranosidase
MNHKLEKANNYISENKSKVNHKFRHQYHLMGEVGWINDPNGFSMFKGEYHLFFQYHPYSAKWGPMHWGHAKSKDLISWEPLPVALSPVGDESSPEGGTIFSGCAIEKDNLQYLIYTENWPKRQVQSIARSVDGINYEPLAINPIIDTQMLPDNSSPADFRDPKVWKKGEFYYLIVSSRTLNDKGQLLLYKSQDLKTWKFESTLITHGGDLGYIWECPDIFSLKDKDILLVSAQYFPSKDNDFNNVHSSLYFVGDLDYNQGKYDFSDFKEIDNGFDFYAPQTIIDDKNRRIMIAWMAMWERTMPTNVLGHNWAGSITLPRVLDLVDGCLIQKPVEEIKNYRLNLEELNEVISKEQTTVFKGEVCELEVKINNIDALSFGIKVFQGELCETVLTYDVEKELLIFDRSNSGYIMKSETNREKDILLRKTKVLLEDNQLGLQIFLDKSSVEVFIQNGKKTMTALVYPHDGSDGISVFANRGKARFKINKWDLKR